MTDSMKSRIDAKLIQKAADIAAAKPAVPDRADDPDLVAALERVERGELAAAYRTKNGALVITHRSDPSNSPAAPEANPQGR